MGATTACQSISMVTALCLKYPFSRKWPVFCLILELQHNITVTKRLFSINTQETEPYFILNKRFMVGMIYLVYRPFLFSIFSTLYCTVIGLADYKSVHYTVLLLVLLIINRYRTANESEFSVPSFLNVGITYLEIEIDKSFIILAINHISIM